MYNLNCETENFHCVKFTINFHEMCNKKCDEDKRRGCKYLYKNVRNIYTVDGSNSIGLSKCVRVIWSSSHRSFVISDRNKSGSHLRQFHYTMINWCTVQWGLIVKKLFNPLESFQRLWLLNTYFSTEFKFYFIYRKYEVGYLIAGSILV